MMPPGPPSSEATLLSLRREAEELGLPWAASWDRAHLNAVLARARSLKRMRLSQLKREAARTGVEPGDQRRKADWVASILRAEFPQAPEPIRSEARPVQPVAGAAVLKVSGAVGMSLIVFVMALMPLASWKLAQASRSAGQGAAIWAGSTADTLRASADGLQSASDALESSNRALRSVGVSLDDAQPLLTSVGEVLGQQAPEAISAARQSLIDAESGAQAVDRVLGGLSFLGIGYDPDHPLAQGLAETADSLEPLPAALSETSQHLETTQKDMGQISRDVIGVSDDLATLASQISPVAGDLAQQADDLDRLADDLDHWSSMASGWVWSGTAALEVILLVAGVTQYAVWVAGRRWSE